MLQSTSTVETEADPVFVNDGWGRDAMNGHRALVASQVAESDRFLESRPNLPMQKGVRSTLYQPAHGQCLGGLNNTRDPIEIAGSVNVHRTVFLGDFA